ncbi:MAG: FAD:protein FMN transferase [Clostridiales bacterium]|nr:FAD:protein FMN transferase [Clostridiales bacterium]
MRKRLLSLVCMLALLLPSCPASASAVKSRHTSDYFSTVSALFLYTDDNEAFEQAWTLVKQTLEQIQSAVSLSDPASDLSRFNRLRYGESCSVGDITAAVFQTALAAYKATDGLYDPTVYPLVDLWGFSPRFNQNVYAPVQPYDRAYENGKLPLPDERYIQAFQKLTGLDGIELLGNAEAGWTLRKNIPPVCVEEAVFQAQLDLGGIAKGYACDLVTQLLREHGFTQGHFVCGGSSISLLGAPDGDYALTLSKPRSGDSAESYYATVYASDTTLSTSSDANHTYLADGVIYCHIIDPRTGYPINMPQEGAPQRGIATVTLLGPSAAYNDALSTALCVMGPARAVAYVNAFLQNQPVAMVFYETGQPFSEVFTNLPSSACVLEDAAYRPASRLTESGEAEYIGSLFSQELKEGIK